MYKEYNYRQIMIIKYADDRDNTENWVEPAYAGHDRAAVP